MGANAHSKQTFSAHSPKDGFGLWLSFRVHAGMSDLSASATRKADRAASENRRDRT